MQFFVLAALVAQWHIVYRISRCPLHSVNTYSITNVNSIHGHIYLPNVHTNSFCGELNFFIAGCCFRAILSRTVQWIDTTLSKNSHVRPYPQPIWFPNDSIGKQTIYYSNESVCGFHILHPQKVSMSHWMRLDDVGVWKWTYIDQCEAKCWPYYVVLYLNHRMKVKIERKASTTTRRFK